MKSVIRVHEPHFVEQEIEIELPLYRKHVIELDEADCIIYSKWGGGLDEWSLTHTRSNERESWEIEKKPHHPPHPREDSDYVLCRGKYASTASEFEWAMDKFRTFLVPVT